MPKRQMLGAKITFIGVSALADSIICFFAVGLILVGINGAGVPVRLAGIMTFNAFIAVSFSAGAIAGAFLGTYFTGKANIPKSDFTTHSPNKEALQKAISFFVQLSSVQLIEVPVPY